MRVYVEKVTNGLSVELFRALQMLRCWEVSFETKLQTGTQLRHQLAHPCRTKSNEFTIFDGISIRIVIKNMARILSLARILSAPLLKSLSYII